MKCVACVAFRCRGETCSSVELVLIGTLCILDLCFRYRLSLPALVFNIQHSTFIVSDFISSTFVCRIASHVLHSTFNVYSYAQTSTCRSWRPRCRSSRSSTRSERGGTSVSTRRRRSGCREGCSNPENNITDGACVWRELDNIGMRFHAFVGVVCALLFQTNCTVFNTDEFVYCHIAICTCS